MDAPLISNTGTAYLILGTRSQGGIIASNAPTSHGTSANPPGMPLNPKTGVFDGTPVSQGRYPCSVFARNAGGVGTGTIVIFVNRGEPIIPSQSLTVRVGDHVNYQVQTEGPWGANEWRGATATDSLPPGLGVTSGGYINGTPTTAGSYHLVVQAGNSRGYGTGQITVTVLAAAGGGTPPASTPPAVADGEIHAIQGQPITPFAVAITGGAYSQLGSAGLPTGLSLSNTGQITGTPTVQGTFTATVTATNAAGSDTGTIAIQVEPGDDGTGGGGSDDVDDGTETSPNIVITWDLVAGTASVTNGAPEAYLGEQKIIEVHVTPAKYAGSITNLVYTFKEAGQPQQHRTLLPQTTATAGGGTGVYVFPVTTFDGDALKASLLLLDGTPQPSLGVVYDFALSCFWNGKPRKSNALGWSILRPEDLEPGDAAIVDPGNPVIDEDAAHEFTYLLNPALVPGQTYRLRLPFDVAGRFASLDYRALLSSPEERLIITPDYGAQKLFACGWLLTLLPPEDAPPGGYTGIPAPISVTAHLFGKPWIDADAPALPVWLGPDLIETPVPTTQLMQSPNGSLFNVGPDDNGEMVATPAA